MTEEYFNQLVEYYKEALTNSMVNEGSRGEAKRARRLPKLDPAATDARAIRILGKGFSSGFLSQAAGEMSKVDPRLSTIIRSAAANTAVQRKREAMKGKPWTPDAGHQSVQKWLKNTK